MPRMTVTPLFFKTLNKLVILEWRLGLGRLINSSPATIGRIMVVTTIGRRSGRKRRTPVNYTRGDTEHVYCVAGFGRQSDWYRNLQVNPTVEVWLPDGRWEGSAETMTDVEDWLPIMRQVLIDSGFATPTFAGFDPRTIPDEELQAETEDWPLVRIRLERPRRGPGGPGDLQWVWPAFGTIMLAWLWLRRRMRSDARS